MATDVTLIGSGGETTDNVLDLTGNTEAKDVIDLTGGPSHTPVDLTGNTDEVNTDDKQPVTLDENGKVIEPEKAPDSTEGKEPEGDKKDETTADEQPQFFFGELEVDVEVPAEISAQLAEAGVDEATLLGELFDKEGKFELSEETRGKLEAKFGKLMVDGYLNMYKGLNAQTVAAHAQTVKDADTRMAEQQGEYKELVGGAEGLAAMETFILGSFDEKQIASYNAIMAGDNWEAQKMVIQLARQQMAAHDKLTNGDRTIKLLGDGEANTTGNSDDLTGRTSLSAAEYSKIMNDPSGKYWDDRAYQVQVDALRSAGLKARR